MTTTMHEEIYVALQKLPDHLTRQSGGAFYTGRLAFSGKSDLYLLGLNPGGSVEAHLENTLRASIDHFYHGPERYSSYIDESWREGSAPGQSPVQKRVQGLLASLRLDPYKTPASNLIFTRTKNEAGLGDMKSGLIETCWPVHDAVIRAMGIRVVVCFGKTSGEWVRCKMGANHWTQNFVERNNRRWTSSAYQADDGKVVVAVTHPSRADCRTQMPIRQTWWHIH